ncbi:hypothetical protein E2C01_065254 [Portunus trituberculatus]|uniref:Uncharacterized protein n=1 Tax=Portunus trituberculatus TaxID=210409 RepID=A0A5B7HP33_PORTR|nr:hypothetical protein [Portunus trituberculatus]
MAEQELDYVGLCLNSIMAGVNRRYRGEDYMWRDGRGGNRVAREGRSVIKKVYRIKRAGEG